MAETAPPACRAGRGKGVHRLRYASVSHHPLDYLGMRALPEKDRGTGVSEVVKRYPGETSAFQERPEGSVGEVAHINGRTDGRGQDESVLSP
jgi:hypothetical protein